MDRAFGCARSTANHVWSYDFVEDRTHDGRRYRMLNVLDVGDPCRPQAQGDRCDRYSVRPVHPAWHSRSHPLRHGPEFVAEDVQEWMGAVGAKIAYFERGSPWENGYIESFNARLRDELLNGEIFYTLREAQIVIESWRRHYNTIRPHASPSDTSHQHQRYSCLHSPPANLKLTCDLDHPAGADQEAVSRPLAVSWIYHHLQSEGHWRPRVWPVNELPIQSRQGPP
jgi:Integrase core domain